MTHAGFSDIQRLPIASAWRACRAEDIVELLNYGTVRTSLIIQFQKQEIRERIMEELIKAFRPYERGTGLEVGCHSIMATGVCATAWSCGCRYGAAAFAMASLRAGSTVGSFMIRNM
jgi:hypothetical protein